ncbi:MAG TPA: tetratricopeptide repeat protein [Blastocatellia bacterium]|nr:tetratricopeptide repeat protein [Blastocatellia bacterium]
MVRGLTGDVDGCISDNTKAIELSPRLAEAWHNRGLAWRTRGDPDRSLADLNEALRLNPKYFEA